MARNYWYVNVYADKIMMPALPGEPIDIVAHPDAYLALMANTEFSDEGEDEIGFYQSYIIDWPGVFNLYDHNHNQFLDYLYSLAPKHTELDTEINFEDLF